MTDIICNYRNEDIVKVTNEAINNIHKCEVIYFYSKLDFSQPFNVLEVYAKTLENCKKNIDFYYEKGYKNNVL